MSRDWLPERDARVQWLQCNHSEESEILRRLHMKKPPLTAEQISAYLATGGNACPFCQSESIEGTTDREYNGETQDHLIECLTCERQWRDVYTLTDVIPAEEA